MRLGASLPRSLVAACASTLLVWGCAALGLDTGREVVEIDRFERAAELLDSGDFAEADSALRRLAARCEAGTEGRRSVLLLAALRLDPRNPGAAPDSAALMAARYLRLPDGIASERSMAEGIYLTALELGADPGLRPAPDEGRDAPARRFSDCEAAPLASTDPLELPVLDREPLALTVARLSRQVDSLTTRGQGLGTSNQALDARVKELETELLRIRSLLRGGVDTLRTLRTPPLPDRRR